MNMHAHYTRDAEDVPIETLVRIGAALPSWWPSVWD